MRFEISSNDYKLSIELFCLFLRPCFMSIVNLIVDIVVVKSR